MLANDAYLSAVRGQRDPVTGKQQRNRDAHEAIVSEELFAAAAKSGRALPVERKGERTKVADVGLLIGFIRCAACGHKLRRRASSKKAGVTYACHGHFAEPCPDPAAILISKADAYVASAIAESEDERVIALGNAERRHVMAREAVERTQRD